MSWRAVVESAAMPVISIRLDDELHHRLRLRADGAQLSISALLRPVIADAVYPGGRYLYTSHDELIGIAIQTYAMLVTLARTQSPQAFEEGIAQGRTLLREHGLLPSDLVTAQPESTSRPRAPGTPQ
jgi:plasmid stability protein